MRGGLDLDESIQTARWLAEDGADFIHLSLWDASRNTNKRPEEHALNLFRSALNEEVRLVAAGNIWTRADAEAALARGASAVAIGQAAIANLDWVARVSDPGREVRRPPLTIAELRERGLNPTFCGKYAKLEGVRRGLASLRRASKLARAAAQLAWLARPWPLA